MKRAFSVFNSLLRDHTPLSTSAMANLVTDFKDWKFKDPPSYKDLPINENPEYNIPVAVNNAVFSKVNSKQILI